MHREDRFDECDCPECVSARLLNIRVMNDLFERRKEIVSKGLFKTCPVCGDMVIKMGTMGTMGNFYRCLNDKCRKEMK